MRLCIIDETGLCVNVIEAESENPEFLKAFVFEDEEAVVSGDELPKPLFFAPNHSGAIGWILADGTWTRPVVEEPVKTEDELAAEIRVRRDAKLAQTDWIVIKSYERGENIPAAWELYRQALRDITAQDGFPYSVEWPTKPE